MDENPYESPKSHDDAASVVTPRSLLRSCGRAAGLGMIGFGAFAGALFVIELPHTLRGLIHDPRLPIGLLVAMALAGSEALAIEAGALNRSIVLRVFISSLLVSIATAMSNSIFDAGGARRQPFDYAFMARSLTGVLIASVLLLVVRLLVQNANWKARD